MRPERTRQPATYADLVKVSDHLVAEILDGELHVNPRPAPRHAAASSSVGGVLWGPFDRGRGGPGGWRILDEPEFHLTADVLMPDLRGDGANGLHAAIAEVFGAAAVLVAG